MTKPSMTNRCDYKIQATIPNANIPAEIKTTLGKVEGARPIVFHISKLGAYPSSMIDTTITRIANAMKLQSDS